jgi:glycosyltransferase involved in cell wall biosynthesis
MTGNPRPLRIGVVPYLDGAGGGIYQYSTTMLDGLLSIEPRPDLILFYDRRDGSNSEVWRARGYKVMSLWPSTVRWKLGRAVGRIAGTFGKRPPGLTPRDRVKVNSALREWLSSSDVDLLIFTSPTTVALDAGLPFVMAVHDLQHRLHPEFPEVSADGEWEFREYLFRNGVERALTILVDSEVGREDVLEIYGELVPRERVRVLPFLPAAIPDPASAAQASPAVRERLGVPDRYLLFPAQFWPHKNHVRVVRAIAQLRSNRGVDVPVVMCGSAGGALRSSVLDAVRRTAAEEGVGDLVTILGYVDDDLMAPLYAGSRGVLLPTFFGPTNIPVLEAWAFGVPLLTSDLRGIREQVGDAAILVDPDSVAAIAEGIRVLWTDEPRRNELVSAGTKRLAEYGRADYLARLSSIVEDAGRRARRAPEAPIEPVEPAEPIEPAEPAATSLEPGPNVSVIIPAHNRAGVIAAALESVRNQSFSALEVIVVDDCSTDDTAEVVRSVARDDPRIRLLVHPQNRGAQAARNTGIRAARGEWIAFLDSDDRYYPDSIATRLEAAKRDGLDVVHSPCDALGPDGDTPFPIPPVEGDVYRALLTAPAPMFQGMLVKRDLLHRIGLLSESVPAYQEWDTSIRLAAVARFGFVPKPTFVYDLRTSGAISRDSRRAADGYEHVVSAHWREVVRVAGPGTLASHYRIAAELRARAGDRRGAVRCAALSWLIWPLSPRRALRLVRRIASPGRRTNGSTPAADA